MTTFFDNNPSLDDPNPIDRCNYFPTKNEIDGWYRDAREGGATEKEAWDYVDEMSHQSPSLYRQFT